MSEDIMGQITKIKVADKKSTATLETELKETRRSLLVIQNNVEMKRILGSFFNEHVSFLEQYIPQRKSVETNNLTLI